MLKYYLVNAAINVTGPVKTGHVGANYITGNIIFSNGINIKYSVISSIYLIVCVKSVLKFS